MRVASLVVRRGFSPSVASSLNNAPSQSVGGLGTTAGWRRLGFFGMVVCLLALGCALAGGAVSAEAQVSVSPTSLGFGNQVVNTTSAALPVTVTNNQATGLTLTPPTLSGVFALAGGTCGTTLAPGGSCSYLVTFTPGTLGTLGSVLNVVFNAGGSPIGVPLSGVGVAPVGAAPASVPFANEYLGSTSPASTVTVTNYQASTLTLGAPTTTGDFSVTGGTCNTSLGAHSSCTYLVAFTPEATGTRSGTLSVNDNAANSPQTVALSGVGVSTPILTGVTPGSGALGTAVPVTINGKNTHFTIGTPVISPMAGITVSNVTAVSATQISATFSVAANATPGPREVTVTTGSETVALGGAFIVTSSAPLAITNILPASGAQGQQLTVTVTGAGTHFAQGTTTANFGSGVHVDTLTITDETHAAAVVTVSATTNVGARNVTLLTGGELAVLDSGFTVTSGPATLATIAPTSSAQGTNLTVTLNGVNTHFLQGATTASFGAGINTGTVTVIGAHQATASIAVTATAAVGLHDVTATTGSEVVTLPAAFTVIGTTPYLSSVAPNSGQQGQTLSVVFTGVNTSFAASGANATTVAFGSNITVNSFTVNSATTATANITIGALAAEGERTGILTVGTTDFPFAFTVQAAPSTAIASISPDSGPQGAALTLTVTGVGTLWTQADTTALFLTPPPGCGQLLVTKTTIQSNTSATLNISIPTNACVETETLQISTGGQVLTGAFSVFANTPTLAISPSNAMPGSTLSVNLFGDFTHFAAGTTTAVIDGQGVTISKFKVTSLVSATATFTVAATALAGGHTVTLTTTGLPTGSEIVATGFSVTTTPAYLLSITPYNALLGATVGVHIAGVNTHFAQGTTTVALGPNVTVSGVTVQSPTSLTATVAVSQLAALGWRNAYVNTGAEQLTIGFRIDSLEPLLSGVSPASGAQGQSLQVTITGQNTHFVQGTTAAIVGAGVTVSNLAVASPTSATATIAISPTAPTGPNTVIMETGTEIASGSGAFTVTGGAAQITAVTLHGQAGTPVLAQNETVNLTITGSATHWLQGETTANFGGGVDVDQLTITDATHATAQVTVLSTAALGFQPVTLFTDGESATIAQGFDIEAGTPTLLSANPNLGLQGTTVSIQVLGQFTHWQTGVTVATIGASGSGVAATFTATDSVSGIITAVVSPLTYTTASPGCDAVTLTTGTSEQVSLQNEFCIGAGAAELTAITPASASQGTTVTVAVTGQGTHFEQGVTTANFGAGINAGNVTVTSPTQASLSLAVTTGATVGFHTATLSTLGENASLTNTFSVVPGVATLNGCSPVAGGQQGQTLSVHCIGQFTSWVQGTTKATFGAGVTVNTVTVDDATDLDANITIDPLAFVGGRTVTVTTGTQIVSAAVFSVIAGPAIISGSMPVGGNQGQEVVLTITGQNTHWIQGLTQFSIAGAGIDITINNVIINSPTSATADVSISNTAALGARSLYMITAGEVLIDGTPQEHGGGFVVTGGIPVITYLSPNSGAPGATNLNVQINGFLTKWAAGTTVDFGPGITVQSYTVNSNTSITAVISIGSTAALGYRTVAVRTGTQGLVGAFQVVSPVPPTPYMYATPGAGLPGQTFTVSFIGNYTQWAPLAAANPTQIVFGATGDGITVNNFQVTSPTTALANITIAANAAASQQTVTFTTGSETETVPFSIVDAVPVISIVDPGTGMQGATLNVNVLGQYTTFNQTKTVFDFGPGITVNSQTVLGPTVAQVNITIGQTAPQGGSNVTETTGTEVASESNAFAVTPSQATITSITPNTAGQSASVSVTVTGSDTHWTSATVFSFGGGITVASQSVASATSATLNLTIAALATPGVYTLTATTGGEVATLANAFVVQPTTPLILSSGPASGPQQGQVSFTILGQQTEWVQGQTTVSFGSGVTIGTTTVTSPTAITVTGTVGATTYPGARDLTVTTGTQTLTLPSAFYVTNGPAVINSLTPPSGKQGQTLNVAIAGTNTNFTSGVTVPNFGQGVVVNTFTVTNTFSATANVTVAATATVQLNTVTLTTLGETASGVNAFEIVQAEPVVTFVSQNTGFQATTQTVTVDALFTHFNSTTTFNFGAGITTGAITITNATTAQVTITISPIAALGGRNLTAVTTLPGGGTEVASGQNLFTVEAGAASIGSLSPASGRQNQGGIAVTVTGVKTHFTDATPTVSFGPYVTVTAVKVTNDLSLVATINVSGSAPTGQYNVTVTTGGEVAEIADGFTITAGTPVVASVSPNTLPQEQSANVVVTGQYTHFAQGATTAVFGGGIKVTGAVTVNSPTQATVPITVPATGTLGAHSVTMTTTLAGGGTETAYATGIFSITQATGTAALTPTSAVQGQTLSVSIAGVGTQFVQGTTTVVFGGGIQTQSVTVSSATAAVATILVPTTATVGAQTVTITTGIEVVTGSFTVVAGTPAVSVISPNTISPTQTVAVTVTGSFTNWGSTTKANFGPGISVGGAAAGAFGPVTVTNATTLTANLVTAGAALGARSVQIQTGTQTLTVNAGITVQTCTTTAPTVVLTSPSYNSSDVPASTVLQWQFSVPMNRTTFSVYDPNTNPGGTVSVYDNAGSFVDGVVALDASGRVATFTPNQPLAIEQAYQARVGYYNPVTDTCGNTLTSSYNYFTTDFTASTTGPKLLLTSPVGGDANIATNAPISLEFDHALDPITAENGFTVTQAGAAVTGTYSFSTDGTIVTFAPTSLNPSTTYTVNYSAAILDTSGNATATPGSYSFTTGTGPVTSGPTAVFVDPPNGATGVGTNVIPHVVFSEPVSAISFTPSANAYGVYLTDNSTGQSIPVTTAVSADRLSASFTPTLPLTPETQYRLYLDGYTDVAQNYGQYLYPYFTTGTGAVTGGTTVAAISPANKAAAVPLNSTVQALMSGLVDRSTITQTSITLTPAVAGAVFLASDNETLTFTPAAQLAASTTYTVKVGGFKDVDGNAVTPSTTTFATGTAANPGGMSYTVSPGNGVSGVPVNSNIVLTFSSSDLDSLTVNDQTIQITGGGNTIGGSFAINGGVVTFTPYSVLPPNTTIHVYSYNTVTDTAGDSVYISSNFTTGSGTDTTAPKVVAVSPANGTQNVGLYTPVVLMLSKSVNPQTVNSATVNLFVGDKPLNSSSSMSPDNRSITLNYYYGQLPAGATITVVASNAVQDLYGNPLVPFTSTFATTPAVGPTAPTIMLSQQRPANGATQVPVNAIITLYANEALQASTVPGAVHVAANGVPVAGTAQLLSGGAAIEFTPTNPFPAGASIQIFVDNTLLDVNGNPLNNQTTGSPYTGYFTTGPSPAVSGPNFVARNPQYGQTGVALNSTIEFEYDQPLDPATVNTTNVTLYDSVVGTIIPTLTLTNNNQVIRISVPSGTLDSNANYQAYVSNAVQNPEGQPAAASSAYFTTGTAADTVAPTITQVIPTNGAQGIGTNAKVTLYFSKPVDPISVNSTTVTLTSGGTALPYTLFNGGTYATLTPVGPLPASATISVAVDGIESQTGVAVAKQTTSFGTLATTDFAGPYAVASSVANGTTGVPVNSAFSLRFNKPLDPTTLNANNFYLYQYGNDGTQYVEPVSATLSISADLMTVYLVPTAPLLANNPYYLYCNSLQDLDGNSQSPNFGASFTTEYTPSTTGPTVVGTNPPNGWQQVPTNTPIQVQFNEPVMGTSLAGVTLAQGANVVPATVSLTNGGQLLTLTPNAPLAGGATYTLKIAGVEDNAGNAMAATVTQTFGTAPSINLVAPTVTLIEPANNQSGVGVNIHPRVFFSEAVNPLSVTSANFQLQRYFSGPNETLEGTVTVAANGLSATFTPAAPLVPEARYQLYLSGYTDIAGNSGSASNTYFYTGTGAITGGTTVAAVSPAAGAQGIPLNAVVQLQMSGPVDLTTGAITLTPSGGAAVAGTISVLTDNATFTFKPTAQLSAGTTYTVNASAFNDIEGNAVPTFTSTFTTGGAPTSGGLSVSINPGNGATGVLVNTPIVFSFSSTVLDPITVNAQTVTVEDTATGSNLAGSLSISGGNVTFTPLSPLPGNTRFYASTSGVQDTAGNTTYSYSGASSFTTANIQDTTPLTVTAISPTNGTLNVGQYTPVTMTFSKSVNPQTVNANTLSLFNGDTPISTSYTMSADNRSVLLGNGALPFGGAITAVATNGVQDLSGNALTPFTSTFTVTPAVTGTGPTLMGQRPGPNAALVPVNATITLFSSEALNAATVPGAVHVVANGAPVAGTVKVLNATQAIEFTPTSPYPYGALVQVFVDPTREDATGNQLSGGYQGYFSTEGNPATTAPTPIAITPAYGEQNVPLNEVLRVEYNQPLNPSTVTAANTTFYCYSGTYYSGSPQAVSLSANNQLVTITPPSGALYPSSTCSVSFQSMTDAQGQPVPANQVLYFNTGTATNTVAPTITYVTPPNKATGIGTNAAVKVLFSSPIDASTVNSSTVQLTSGGVAIPATIGVTTSGTEAEVTPLAPLLVGATVSVVVSGVQSETGVAVAAQTTKFGTLGYPDFNPPYVIASSIGSNQTVPSNAVFTAQFDKPIDPSSFNPNNVQVYPYATGIYVPATVSYSADLTTVILKPTSPLSPGGYGFYVFGMTDLVGNAQTNFEVGFTAAAAADTTPLTVTAISPPAKLTGVPTNAPVEIAFSALVDGNTLGQITLSAGGAVVPASVSLINGDQAVLLEPNAPLGPNTVYTVTVAGVTDIAGNGLAKPFTGTFTTGPTAVLAEPTVASVTPANGSLNVSDSTSAITVVFSAAMDPVSFTTQRFYLENETTGTLVPTTLSFSPDYTAATLTPTSPLAAATSYIVYFASNSYDSYGYLTDLAGNSLYYYPYYGSSSFTTQ